MFKIGKEINFESAHQLLGHPKCGKLHGHSYKVEIIIESHELDPQGFIADFGILSQIIKVRYDHSGNVINQSAEQLAETIADMVKGIIKVRFEFIKVKVWETESSWAEYVD